MATKEGSRTASNASVRSRAHFFQGQLVCGETFVCRLIVTKNERKTHFMWSLTSSFPGEWNLSLIGMPTATPE